jgi:hypothetical protein
LKKILAGTSVAIFLTIAFTRDSQHFSTFAQKSRLLTKENVKASGYAFLFTGVLVALIVIGSRQLTHFDAALVAYTFAALFAVFGLVYRYAIWLQRPPTAVYWKRGWQVFLQRGHRGRNVNIWVRRVTSEFAANSFIFKRSKLRWLAHMAIMWGCVIAAAITFPLVFGWMSFESVPGGLSCSGQSGSGP